MYGCPKYIILIYYLASALSTNYILSLKITMMESNKNILNSNLFQTPLPLQPRPHSLQRPLLVKHSEEEVVQSFKIKRNALMEALQSKKEVSFNTPLKLILI